MKEKKDNEKTYEHKQTAVEMKTIVFYTTFPLGFIHE